MSMWGPLKLHETCSCGATLDIDTENSPTGQDYAKGQADKFREAHGTCRARLEAVRTPVLPSLQPKPQPVGQRYGGSD
jgi:hypothetical protein